MARKSATRDSRKRASQRSDRGRGGRLGKAWKIQSIHLSDGVAGPNVVVPSLDEMLSAFRGMPEELDWVGVAPQVIPVVPRVRPYAAGFPEPIRTVVPPGVAIGFGIDMGPAFINVTSELLERWSISLADVTARALVNLHDRAALVRPDDIIDAPIGDVRVRALQTGYYVASTLVLAPGELRRLFGSEPRLFIAPMRDLILGLPPDIEGEHAAWLFDELASADPNCLAPMGYRWDGDVIKLESLDPSPELPGRSPAPTSALVA